MGDSIGIGADGAGSDAATSGVGAVAVQTPANMSAEAPEVAIMKERPIARR